MKVLHYNSWSSRNAGFTVDTRKIQKWCSSEAVAPRRLESACQIKCARSVKMWLISRCQLPPVFAVWKVTLRWTGGLSSTTLVAMVVLRVMANENDNKWKPSWGDDILTSCQKPRISSVMSLSVGADLYYVIFFKSCCNEMVQILTFIKGHPATKWMESKKKDLSTRFVIFYCHDWLSFQTCKTLVFWTL